MLHSFTALHAHFNSMPDSRPENGPPNLTGSLPAREGGAFQAISGQHRNTVTERARRQESSKPALPQVPDKSLDLSASRFSLSVKCTEFSQRFPEGEAEGNV